MGALILAPLVVAAAEPDLGSADRSGLEVANAYASLAATTGRFPPTYLEAKLDGPVKAAYYAAELGSEGMLKITFNESADPVLAGKELKAIPTINESGDMVWYCLAPDIPRHMRPRSCL